MKADRSARFATATGYIVETLPPGDARDEILGLVRLGSKFKSQHVGKRHDFLTRYLIDLARTLKQPVSFAALLDALELEAARRELHGERASPVEKIDRVWQLATYHDPKRGRVQIPFGTLRNRLTAIRKIICAQ